MNISFTEKQDEHISRQVASGEYQNNSEVIRDALRQEGFLVLYQYISLNFWLIHEFLFRLRYLQI